MEQKTRAHASTPEMKLMHEAEKQGAMHHFSPERGPPERQHARRSPRPAPGNPKNAARAAGAVCVRLPANPMNSVPVRKPPGMKIRKCGPGAGAVCVRLPANPMNSVLVRKPPGLKFRKCGPGAGPGLRTPARKPTAFGSRTQTPGPEIQKVRPGGRPRFAYACPQTH